MHMLRFFPHTCYWLLVFPRLASIASVPVRVTVCKFSRAWHQLLFFSCTCRLLLVFPLLTSIANFPVLDTSCSFYGAWHRILLFPRLASIASFSAPVTACLLAVSTGCTFLLRILIGLLRLLWLARSENFRFGVTKVANFLKANRIVPVTSLPESWKHLPSFQRRRPYSGVSLETAWTRRVLTPAIEIKFEVRRHSFCSVHWSPWEGHRVSSDFPLLRVWKVKGVSSSLWNVMC